MTQDQRRAETHDALWAVLWNRRYDDVDEPVWLPDVGVLGHPRVRARPRCGSRRCARSTPARRSSSSAAPARPPAGRQPRAHAAGGARALALRRRRSPLGLGIELRFDEQRRSTKRLGRDAARRRAARARAARRCGASAGGAARAARRAATSRRQLEEIWREEIAGDQRPRHARDRVHAAGARRARAGAREGRAQPPTKRSAASSPRARSASPSAATKRSAAFREERWPRDPRRRARPRCSKYVDYRTEVVRLEDALQRLRGARRRARRTSTTALDAHRARRLPRAAGLQLDAPGSTKPSTPRSCCAPSSCCTPRSRSARRTAATSFSAYRAPTAGPSVIPPRY